MKKRIQWTLSLLFLVLLPGCGKEDDGTNVVEVDPGNDPNFTIVPHADEGLEAFNRKVVVFGLDIYAVAAVEDEKLLHAANVLAQYLDNDEDGEVDDDRVWQAMMDQRAFMVMWKTESDLDIEPPAGREGQDLGNDETRPEWHHTRAGAFDASLEEVWHIVTHAGYAEAYPDAFGEQVGSALARAMDKARGGQFMDVPASYPADAWYTYDDETCDYSCMVTEYFYWAMTTILGAQINRLEEIGQEWRLNTLDKIKAGDPDVYALLTNAPFNLPTILPDGTYRR